LAGMFLGFLSNSSANHGKNKNVLTVMVNNSANIKKNNIFLSSQIIEVLTQKRQLGKESLNSDDGQHFH